ncbi:MAG: stage 0 sporulation family protein [Desulfuromonadales bacterium]|nr:stage 0 sporulation family protein [Desulfuromonadales bacterium]
MIRLVTVKFRDAGRQYDFNAQNYRFGRGDKIIVETDRGRALATVVVPPREIADEEAPENLKAVLRPATADDLTMASGNTAREEEAQRYTHKRIQERSLDMKLVRAEYLFDGSKIIFYFTADGRIDFRELVKDLAHHFHTRIEMRQIGVRDEAKMIGGLGVCGRELCCCSFLTEFTPVSVKMAKEQGLALNPGKISGQCGRLLCCLSYEYETYCDLKKGLPKSGRKLVWDGQDAIVCDTHILQRTITLLLADGTRTEVSAEQFSAGNAPPCAGKHRSGKESGHTCSRHQKHTESPAGTTPLPPSAESNQTLEGDKHRPQQDPLDGDTDGDKPQRRNRSRNRRSRRSSSAEGGTKEQETKRQQPPPNNSPPAEKAGEPLKGQTDGKKRIRRRGRRRGRSDKPDSGDK